VAAAVVTMAAAVAITARPGPAITGRKPIADRIATTSMADGSAALRAGPFRTDDARLIEDTDLEIRRTKAA
jgi:hypothetical protein